MECPGVKVEVAEVQHLEPLIIIEEGDITESMTGPETAESSRGDEGAGQEHGQHGKTTSESEEDEGNGKDHLETEQVSEETKDLKRETETEEEENRTPGDDEKEQPGGIRREETEDKTEMDGTETAGGKTGREDRSQDGEEMTMKNQEGEADLKVHFATETQVLQADANGLVSSDQPEKQTLSLVDAEKQARRLTPDFPDALYELLCTLQEGRRLNDQRCSFRREREGRRRCHSEPSATMPANRVTFSSMTSLQREEFFEMVAVSQARRLNDQRAELLREAPPKTKANRLRSSFRLSLVKKPAAPLPVPKEDLYNMILTSQAQGRLEEQRSVAPGPMDDEDFFSLLLRVQGGRMEEQRTELPTVVQT